MNNVTWHTQGQVALVQCGGDVTLNDLFEAYRALCHMASQVSEPIHVIFDGSRMTSCETNASNITEWQKHANIASITGFGMAPLNRFVMTAFSNIFKVPTFAVSNMVEAEEVVRNSIM